jgi:hypothetical protein
VTRAHPAKVLLVAVALGSVLALGLGGGLQPLADAYLSLLDWVAAEDAYPASR